MIKSTTRVNGERTGMFRIPPAKRVQGAFAGTRVYEYRLEKEVRA